MTSAMPVRIAMWSGPRNISTAMMRSFESRADCYVTDEPFYGAYLKQSGEPQPMADQIIASMNCDWNTVASAMRAPIPDDKAIWYQKHMPHHMIDSVSISDFPDHRHAFLIRAPERVVASYAAKRVTVTPDDLGYARQLKYVDQAAQITGKAPIVIDSANILDNPEYQLRKLCSALEIPWDSAMLHWNGGRRETDGIWGHHWYNRVIETTGFGKNDHKQTDLTALELGVVDACQFYYDKLLEYTDK